MPLGQPEERPLPTTEKRITPVGSGEAVSEAVTERRAHERIRVLIEVDYRADDTFLFAYITDISAMGIFVRTTQPEPPGTRLALRFTPPGDEDPLECEGEVIWINPLRDYYEDDDGRNPGMGIQFAELSLEQRERILALVRTIAYLDHVKPENCQ
jgi:type IV pilus assembly protein PilZ